MKTRVEKLCQAFENGKELVELSQAPPHDISNVLKLYLRQVQLGFIMAGSSDGGVRLEQMGRTSMWQQPDWIKTPGDLVSFTDCPPNLSLHSCPNH